MILGPRSDPDQCFSWCASSIFGKVAYQSLTLPPHWFSRWSVDGSCWTRSDTNWVPMVSASFSLFLQKVCSSWNWQMIRLSGFFISGLTALLVAWVLLHIIWFLLWISFSRVFLDFRTKGGSLRSLGVQPRHCCCGSHGSFDLRKRYVAVILLGRVPWTPFYWDINASCHELCSPSPDSVCKGPFSDWWSFCPQSSTECCSTCAKLFIWRVELEWSLFTTGCVVGSHCCFPHAEQAIHKYSYQIIVKVRIPPFR